MDSDVCPADPSASPSSDFFCPASLPVGGASEVEVTTQTAAAPPGSETEDLDSYNPIEPPPLDWRSDSSSEAGTADDLDDPGFPPSVENLDKASPGEPVLLPLNMSDTVTSLDVSKQELVGNIVEPVQDNGEELEEEVGAVEEEEEDSEGAGEYQEGGTLCEESRVTEEEVEVANRRSGDEDHSRIHSLLNQLQLMGEEPHPSRRTPPHPVQHQYSSRFELDACAPSLITDDITETTGLLFSESHQRDLLGLLQFTEISATHHPTSLSHRGEVDAVVSVSYSQEDAQRFWRHHGNGRQRRHKEDSLSSLPDEEYPEPVWMKLGEEPPEEEEAAAESEQVNSKLVNLLRLFSTEDPFTYTIYIQFNLLRIKKVCISLREV